MPATATTGQFRHVILAEAGELVHWAPFDMAELLGVADQHDVPPRADRTGRSRRPAAASPDPRATHPDLPGPGTRCATHDIRAARRRERRSATRRGLDGVVTGPDARFSWDHLPDNRKADVLRFLFAAVRIGTSSSLTAVFDYSRVEVVRHPL